MKPIKKSLLLLILICCALLSSACFEIDADLLEIAVGAWAEDRGIVQHGEYQPIDLVIEVNKALLEEATRSEEMIQLDGLDVVRDIEKADALADQALQDFDTSKMQSAVSIRPLDWTLQEKDAAVWLANGNGAAAETAFAQSDELLRESLLSGGDCLTLRRQQLETRLDTLWDAAMTYESQPGRKQGDAAELRAQADIVRSQLWQINSKESSPFCP